MKIEDNSVVSFHYTVSEAGQGKLESSRELEPLKVLIGHGNIIPGLETAMKGHEAGETFEVTVNPDQAYGERREGLIQRVPRKHFKGAKLTPGMQVVLPTEQGQRAMTVKKVGISVVDVDLNHPMAGKVLNFDVEILDVREASPEEISHKHVHGDGGHAH
jgi:FKBP-type peptidyl-prolyl cis-trans isomerase SlyD